MAVLSKLPQSFPDSRVKLFLPWGIAIAHGSKVPEIADESKIDLQQANDGALSSRN